jgi:DNA-binding IclR family transcriptional regulator
MEQSSINKAIDVLDLLLQSSEPMDVRTLSEKTGIKISNLYQIISVLTKRNYLYAVDRGKYSIGSKLLILDDDSVSDRLNEMAEPYLKKMAIELGETSIFAIYSKGSIINPRFVLGTNRIQFTNISGFPFPLHACAFGKCILTKLPSKEYAKIIKNMTLTSYTENTITDYSMLQKELSEITNKGIAFDYEEFEVGLNAIAAPVTNQTNGIIATCGIYGPSFRLTKMKLRKLIPVVKKYALEITNVIN